MSSKVFSGARAVLKIDGKRVGWCTNVRGSETIDYNSLAVIGKLEVQEHVPVGYTVQFSASFVRLVGEDLKSQGLLPARDLAGVLAAAELTAEVYDQVEDKALFRIEGVKASSAGWGVDARGVVASNVTFVAKRTRYESEV